MKMSLNEPTILDNAEWHGLFSTWPTLLKKLTLAHGLEYFLDWKYQYLDWSSQSCSKLICIHEARFHAWFLLDHQLLDILMDRHKWLECRMEEDFSDLNFETFANELLDIFEEKYQDVEALDDLNNEEFNEEDD